MSITTYKIAQIVTLLVFTLFISDRRQKHGMTPLVNPKATILLKASYLFPIGAYGYSLLALDALGLVDWISFFGAVLGTILVVKGKLDLGSHHTWTGYYIKGGQRTIRGIYRWLPHPMYTGITMMIVSCSLVYVFRLPWYVSAAALASCTYVVVFLGVAARREDRVLEKVEQVEVV